MTKKQLHVHGNIVFDSVKHQYVSVSSGGSKSSFDRYLEPPNAIFGKIVVWALCPTMGALLHLPLQLTFL